MVAYEYKVIPAPAKGVKVKGVKTPEERFARVLEALMNDLGAEGWEYQRADTLPSTERAGLTGTTTNWRHVLVFRRALRAHDEVPAPKRDWPAPPTDFSPAPRDADDEAAAPRTEERPHRPTLVALRNEPPDSGV